MIREHKFKKKAEPYQTVRRTLSDVKNGPLSQSHYHVKGKLYGHWADDWLTIWQKKNEG